MSEMNTENEVKDLRVNSPGSQQKLVEILDCAKKVIYGQDELLEGILAALICEGHLLIEGMPGLGKTLSVSVMSKLCDLKFNRVQFTPDLLPSDLIGTMIYNQAKEEFHTKYGPIFTQLLLADEINRSPAKVQSALLEAMAEKQVTIGDKTHLLTTPFVVMATQNPIEQEGTYNLPEAQLDRFMMKITVNYPSYDAELKVLELESNPTKDLKTLITTDDIINIQKDVQRIYVDKKIKEMIIRLVQATRPGSDNFNKNYDGAIMSGASPRASLWLLKLSQFKAYLNGRDFVSPDELFAIVPEVLGHRMIMSYEAQIDNINAKDVAVKIARSVL